MSELSPLEVIRVRAFLAEREQGPGCVSALLTLLMGGLLLIFVGMALLALILSGLACQTRDDGTRRCIAVVKSR